MLAGRVYDAHTGQPLAGVVLSCVGDRSVHYCRSDISGCFGFVGIERGCWRLWASKPPYSELTYSYCLRKHRELNIFLQIDGLDDEVVTA